MVGPGEVDEDLQPETAEECSKYGPVAKVIIYEVSKGKLIIFPFRIHYFLSTIIDFIYWPI